MSKPKILAPGVEHYEDTDTLLLIRCPNVAKKTMRLTSLSASAHGAATTRTN